MLCGGCWLSFGSQNMSSDWKATDIVHLLSIWLYSAIFPSSVVCVLLGADHEKRVKKEEEV